MAMLLRAQVLRFVLLPLLSTACGVQYDHTHVQAPSLDGAARTGFQQYCTFNNTSDYAELNEWLRAQAAVGWRLTGIGGRDATIYCFVAETDSQRAPGQGGQPAVVVPPAAGRPIGE
jgi:hypothetical protein